MYVSEQANQKWLINIYGQSNKWLIFFISLPWEDTLIILHDFVWLGKIRKKKTLILLNFHWMFQVLKLLKKNNNNWLGQILKKI